MVLLVLVLFILGVVYVLIVLVLVALAAAGDGGGLMVLLVLVCDSVCVPSCCRCSCCFELRYSDSSPPSSVRLLERIRFSPDRVLRRYVCVLRTFCIAPRCTSFYFIDN